MSIKESVLSTVSNITTSDFIRVVTSAGASRRLSFSTLKAAIASYSSMPLQEYFTGAEGVSDISGTILVFGNTVTIVGQIGGLTLAQGANVLGNLSKYFPSYEGANYSTVGFAGTASTMGALVRVNIANGTSGGTITAYASAAVTGTLRFTATFSTSRI